ncbi:MAG UNVERIFIED_CONTAM: hypothetical protein LVT10_23050 [Anaerolineae bacterium]|jgi:6,7-dimethyl-8-ribityllumazine synthase
MLSGYAPSRLFFPTQDSQVMTDSPIRLAFIISNYYPGFQTMLDAAHDEAQQLGAVVSIVSQVPGVLTCPCLLRSCYNGRMSMQWWRWG